MKIAAVCCTYKRPKQLAQAIESFLRQDYPAELRELVVLDDAGQYAPQRGKGWHIVSVSQRFRTLGEKRNASVASAAANTEAYCVWDDDDIYLPWHMSAAAKSLEVADFAIPSVVYIDKVDRLLAKKNQRLFHGAWSFTRSAFERVNGYPPQQSGQDKGLLVRFREAQLRRADPIQFEPRPSYVYRWYTEHNFHLSAMGATGYEDLEKLPGGSVEPIVPAWDRDWVALHEQLKR